MRYLKFTNSDLLKPWHSNLALLAQSEEAWGAAKPAAHRLVITPRHDERGGSHGCPLCPANLCKGQELEALRAAHPYRTIVYAGDGANDLCPSLALSPSDVVLARKVWNPERNP